jgi:hypothetical protein
MPDLLGATAADFGSLNCAEIYQRLRVEYGQTELAWKTDKVMTPNKIFGSHCLQHDRKDEFQDRASEPCRVQGPLRAGYKDENIPFSLTLWPTWQSRLIIFAESGGSESGGMRSIIVPEVIPDADYS